MPLTPIDVRERSIEELTGRRPDRGTRMYMKQRGSDPYFVDDTHIGSSGQSFDEMPFAAPQSSGKPFRPVSAPTQRHPQGQHRRSHGGGAPAPPQHHDEGGFSDGRSMKPWVSPWEEALQGSTVDAPSSRMMKQYRSAPALRPASAPAHAQSETTGFRRLGTTVGPHGRSLSMPEPTTKPLVKSRELVVQTGATRKARGALMFDKMKKRSQHYVVDDTNVADTSDHYARMRMQVLQDSRARVPSPPPHVGTGYYPPHADAGFSPVSPVSPPGPGRQPARPYKLSISGGKTPWEAAESNPVGSVEEAFYRSGKAPPREGTLAHKVQEAARTKAERSAYEHDAWSRSPHGEPDHHGSINFNLAPKITTVPRVRLGSQPYVNDFNRKPQGWQNDGEPQETVVDHHTLPRTRHSRRPPTDFNPKPKSWAPSRQVHPEPEYHYEEYDEEERVVEHLKPVRMTAKKFDRPQYADRRRTRPSGQVRSVPGPKIWNPTMLEETDDL